ncbi:hypothetical protein, partial [Candidatus Nitrotoga sp. M5]|uniref:hypothetical protein n=1 Tax=Candidatus Nitrotoga sp. M5 TaxID=2890409 RepID=UPI001EF62347
FIKFGPESLKAMVFRGALYFKKFFETVLHQIIKLYFSFLCINQATCSSKTIKRIFLSLQYQQ